MGEQFIRDLSPKEYADMKGVTAQTVRNWIKRKILKADQPAGKKGRWCIQPEKKVQ